MSEGQEGGNRIKRPDCTIDCAANLKKILRRDRMKKFRILALVLCLIMMTSVVPAFAVEDVEEPSESVVVGNVEISFPSSFPEVGKERILSDIYGGEYNSVMMARGIMCTLFGHDVIKGKIIVTTHYARLTGAAHCYQEYRDTERCSRCDYYWYSELRGGTYVICCP